VLRQQRKNETDETNMDLLNDTIAELEARLNLRPGESVSLSSDRTSTATTNASKKTTKEKDPPKPTTAETTSQPSSAAVGSNNCDDQPEICKLEFKVGVITKVWVHEKADKLYCEEIDVGEATGPRQIASGLRPHFTEEQMLGQRVLVVANLKAKNLVGFKSHGMVLCAAGVSSENGEEHERVEFVEPPADAQIGEVVSFQDLPKPNPWSAAQVEKKKVFQNCMDGMKSNEECVAMWNGHAFLTSAGPCTTKTIRNGVLR
jgi:aminoacyl tRNA synthase complex-interacting multifunctional protein 1